MLTIKPVTERRGADFAAVDALYESAFPWHEQRLPAAQAQALNHPNYRLTAWYDGEQFVGMIGAWDFADYSYIEHLAVNAALRGQGYGKRMLAQFLPARPQTILEIDPLTTDVARKRLRFYQSLGFYANSFEHRHPTYHHGMADHELVVLSYPRKINAARYQRFLDDLRDIVMAPFRRSEPGRHQ